MHGLELSAVRVKRVCVLSESEEAASAFSFEIMTLTGTLGYARPLEYLEILTWKPLSLSVS